MYFDVEAMPLQFCQCKLLFLLVLYSPLIIILVTLLQLRHAHLIEDNMWRIILISHPSSVAKSLFLDDLYLWMINLDPRLLIFPLLLPTDEKIGIWGCWEKCEFYKLCKSICICKVYMVVNFK